MSPPGQSSNRRRPLISFAGGDRRISVRGPCDTADAPAVTWRHDAGPSLRRNGRCRASGGAAGSCCGIRPAITRSKTSSALNARAGYLPTISSATSNLRSPATGAGCKPPSIMDTSRWVRALFGAAQIGPGYFLRDAGIFVSLNKSRTKTIAFEVALASWKLTFSYPSKCLDAFCNRFWRCRDFGARASASSAACQLGASPRSGC